MKNLNKFSKSLSVMVLILTIVLVMPLALADNVSNTTNGNETINETTNVDLVPNVFNVEMEDRNIIILLGFLLLISLGLYIIDFKAFSSLIVVIAGFIILTNLNAFIIGLIVLLVGITLIFKI